VAKYAWPAGSTSKTVVVFVQDSSSTTGAGKASLSAGNTNWQQIRVQTDNTVTIGTISVTNLAALTDAYLSGGWFPVSAVNAPGWYRFDLPDALLAAGAVTAAANLLDPGGINIAQLPLEIQLQNTPVDLVSKAGVTVSASTLFPAVVRVWDATSVSSSNVAVADFSTRLNANVQQWSGASVTTGNIALWQTVSQANVTAWAGASVTASFLLPVTVRVWDTTSVSSSNLAVVDFSTRVNANTQQWSGASVTTANIALWQTISGANVTHWAGVTTSASDVAIQNTVVASIGNVNVTMWAGVTVSASNVAIADYTTYQTAITTTLFGTAMTESYAADGATFTWPQFCYQMWSFLSDFSISGTQYTTHRLDGSTTAMTFSLNDPTTPTANTRIV